MKKIGIYLEHSSANLIELSLDLLFAKSEETYYSLFGRKDKNPIHHIERPETYSQNDFLNKLSNCILYYNEVLLFGKSSIINKLFDRIANDNRFYNIRIDVKQTDEMDPEQQKDFVSDYFLLEKLG